MGYLKEFASHWPNLFGAALGLAFGTALNHYMMNLFGPALIAEFGWSKAQFALVGTIGLVGMICMPIAGWLTDRFGSRLAASIGFTVVPVAYLLMSMLSGNIWEFFALQAIKASFGILTATMVFTRVIIERFDRARGLAMAVMLCGPPLVGSALAPILAEVIEAEGWRTAYRVLALLSAVGGFCAVLLIGRGGGARPAPRSKGSELTWAKFRAMCGSRTFVLLILGMFLVNLPQVLVSSQLSVMLMENGASAQFAAALLSVYGLSVVFGRFVSGLALDRISPHIVAIFSLGLPALGYAGLASDFDARWVLAGAIALVGLAQGAETDVAAILTSRRFEISHFSFVYSMLMTSQGLASALGAGLLSLTLRQGGNFNLFLMICALVTLMGAVFFFLTGDARQAREHPIGEPA